MNQIIPTKGITVSKNKDQDFIISLDIKEIKAMLDELEDDKEDKQESFPMSDGPVSQQ